MAEMANRHELTGQEIRSIISTITDMPEQCGFEVYVITKSEPQLNITFPTSETI